MGRVKMKKIQILASILSLSLSFGQEANKKAETQADKTDWIPLFNGKDLDGWTPKFAGSDLGVNYKDTFQVKDGLLTIDYSKWEKFNGEFGHLYYKTPYSNYKIRGTYRFIGKQVNGGPGWANRNDPLKRHSTFRFQLKYCSNRQYASKIRISYL